MSDHIAPESTHHAATDLERRVLAHERILQSLIAYMSRTEPRFIDHLKARFVDPMSLVQREHDYRCAEDYAEDFIRVVIELGSATSASSAHEGSNPETLATCRAGPGVPPDAGQSQSQDKVQVTHRDGIWHVTCDGTFYGDYLTKEYAQVAAALLKMSFK